MGMLKNAIDVRETITQYNIENFVETGTSEGVTLEYLVQFGLNNYSIELEEYLCDMARRNFGAAVNIYQGYTKDEMQNLMNDLSPAPTLFWLDAHFPGERIQASYESELDIDKRIPAEFELKCICKNRDVSKDVIIIDDLRVYVDRPLNAIWNLRKIAGADGYDFVHELLDETHDITEGLLDQGYILCHPKRN